MMHSSLICCRYLVGVPRRGISPKAFNYISHNKDARNADIFMMGEALDSVVPVFEGQRAGRTLTAGVAEEGDVV